MIKFLYLLMSLSWASIALGQDKDAKNLLDQVSKKYDGYQTVQSTFTFKVMPVNGEGYSDQGQLFLNKSSAQYKIALPTQDLISDGKSVWSVLKQDKEVQVSEAENNAQTIGPNNIFTFYKNGYNYLSLANENTKNSGKLSVIELTPVKENSNYSKIKLRINKNLHIQDVTIQDKSGAKYTYQINTLYVNHNIPSSTFQFQQDKYPEFEIVDLR